MKIPCKIIEDLLPLYKDDVCSAESKKVVAKHLDECEKCRRLIAGAEAFTIPYIEPDQPNSDKAIKKGLRKIRHRWWASVLIILALIPIAFLSWNEFSAQGVAITNMDELITGNAFMECLTEGDYEGAFRYIDLEYKKSVWLQDWFEEDDLVTFEADALAKFCAFGEEIEALGGIESYEYVGTSASYGVGHDGSKAYQIYYRVRFAGRDQRFTVDVSNHGIHSFGSAGNFLTDPLAKLGAWSEYLWPDYQGCYFDPASCSYRYYET